MSSPDIDFITSENSWVSSGSLSDSELGVGMGVEKDSQKKSCQGWRKVWEGEVTHSFTHWFM